MQLVVVICLFVAYSCLWYSSSCRAFCWVDCQCW